MSITINEVEALLNGKSINDIEIYKKAFTHKSAVQHEGVKGSGSYETLEFMGDSVLGLIVTKYLLDKYEHLQEGFLTRARTKIVCGETLASISAKLGFDRWIIMDEKGMRTNLFRNPKIMEDVLESFIGAIYLDLGMIEAKKFVISLLNNPNLVDISKLMVDDNYKEILMHVCQQEKWENPTYVKLSHVDDRMFRMGVVVEGKQLGVGIASTKKKAEQAGSYFSLGRLQEQLGRKLLPSKRPNAMIKMYENNNRYENRSNFSRNKQGTRTISPSRDSFVGEVQ